MDVSFSQVMQPIKCLHGEDKAPIQVSQMSIILPGKWPWYLAEIRTREFLETYNIEHQAVGKTAAETSAGGSDERGIMSLNFCDPTVVMTFYRRVGLISGHGYT